MLIDISSFLEEMNVHNFIAVPVSRFETVGSITLSVTGYYLIYLNANNPQQQITFCLVLVGCVQTKKITRPLKLVNYLMKNNYNYLIFSRLFLIEDIFNRVFTFYILDSFH